jgi:hypothetical protein
LPHTTTNNEEIALANGPIGFSEVWSKENIEKGTSYALDGICDGKDCNPFGLLRVNVIFEKRQPDYYQLPRLTYLISGHA